MRTRIALASVLALALGSGCSPTVGDECDEDAARTPYYDTDGTPMYPGQALITEHCVSCHGEDAGFGAPEGLNFPLSLVTGSGAEAVSGGRRLLWAQSNVHRHRDLVYASVVEGDMPPRGFVSTGPSRFADASGAPLPGIQTDEGHEVLRNWLACGSPVVERTTPLVQPCSQDAECQVTNFCDVAEGQCVGVGDVVAPGGGSTVDCDTPDQSWSWIYQCLFSGSAPTTCTSAGCHGATAPASGLAMPDVATAYANLVGQAPGPASLACMGAPEYVIPNDADGSLLVHKLEGVDAAGNPVCGARMPITTMLSPAQIDLVRAWIDAGAARD